MEDNGAAVVPPFVQRFQPAFPVGYADRAAILTYMEVPIIAPGWVPKMVFVDRKGIIRAQYGGEDPFFKEPRGSIRAKLDELLAAPAPNPRKSGKKK